MATITTRTRKDGTTSYYVRYRIKDPDGRTRETTSAFTSETDAQEFVEYIRDTPAAQRNSALSRAGMKGYAPKADSSPRITTLVENFITAKQAEGAINSPTAAKYRDILNKDLAPVLGRKTVAQLNRHDLLVLGNSLTHRKTGAPLSRKTKVNKMVPLIAALNFAVEEGVIKDHCANRLTKKLPRTARKKAAIALTAEQYRLLLEAVTPHYRTLVEFLAESGCRWGEVVALRPTDVFIDKQVVQITKATQHENGIGYTDGVPKTEGSERMVRVRKSLLERLDYGHDYLFTNFDSGPVRQYTFLSNIWYPALKRSGLPEHIRPRIHDLRHTHASWLIEAKAVSDDGRVQRQLGHTSLSTTRGIYTHEVELSKSDEILAALDEILGEGD